MLAIVPGRPNGVVVEVVEHDLITGFDRQVAWFLKTEDAELFVQWMNISEDGALPLNAAVQGRFEALLILVSVVGPILGFLLASWS